MKTKITIQATIVFDDALPDYSGVPMSDMDKVVNIVAAGNSIYDYKIQQVYTEVEAETSWSLEPLSVED